MEYKFPEDWTTEDINKWFGYEVLRLILAKKLHPTKVDKLRMYLDKFTHMGNRRYAKYKPNLNSKRTPFIKDVMWYQTQDNNVKSHIRPSKDLRAFDKDIYSNYDKDH